MRSTPHSSSTLHASSWSTTLGRGLAAAGLTAIALAAGITTASAHAGLGSSSPANGAQLAKAPRAVTLVFPEKVKLDGKGTRIIDGNGTRVPAKASVKGGRVTLTPAAPLPAGRYAAAWHLLSADGDAVEGAISFTVATPNPAGTPVTIAAKPNVPTTLSAAAPGSRTITFTSKATLGDVEWTSSAVPEPINWEATGKGGKVTATGVLPTAGVWSFTATLENGSAVTVVKGSVTLRG